MKATSGTAEAGLDTGTRLRVLRTAHKLTQAELALKAGCSTLTVSKVETGVVSPRTETARKLAAALSCSVGDLLDTGGSASTGFALEAVTRAATDKT